MKLSDKEWKDFFLEDIFSVWSGKRLTNADKIDGTRPFIGATDNMNGVTGFVDNENSSLDKNVLGVNYNGAPCIGFYHPYECIFTDDVKRLHLKNHEDNQYVLLFLKTVILQQKNKYCYGYKFNERRMLRQIITVPVNDNDEPDFQFMEDYMKELMAAKRKQYQKYVEQRLAELGINDVKNTEVGGYNLDLESREWNKCNVNDIFVVGHGFYNKKPPMSENGDFPFIGASGENNGVTGFTTKKDVENNSKLGYGTNEPLDKKIFSKGHLCVVNNGSAIGYTYYQPGNFTCTHDVNPLWLRGCKMNKYLGLFLSQMIKNQGICFAYARKWRPSRMIHSCIMLPVNDNNEPDYDFMEDCGRKMIARKYMQYLKFLESSGMIQGAYDQKIWYVFI